MKCSLCREQIEETFLHKIKGTYLKDAKGKLHSVCHECQIRYKNDKEEMLKKL